MIKTVGFSYENSGSENMSNLQQFVVETQFKPDDSIAVNKSREIETVISVNPDGNHIKAHSPVETVIGALGSCFLINLQRYFKEKGREISDKDVQIILTGYRDPQIPKLVKIDYEVKVNSGLDFNEEDLKKFMAPSSTTYKTFPGTVDISGKVMKLEPLN